MHITDYLTSDQLPEECIEDCSAQGSVGSAVSYWREKLAFTVDRETAIQGLKNTGGWGQEELEVMSDEGIAEKVLWLACCDFREQKDWEKRNPGRDPSESSSGSDIYSLGE